MNQYEIGSSTLAIIPISDKISKVYEEESEYIVNKSANSIIKDSCEFYGSSYEGRCVICGGPGISDAYYCKECTVMQKDVSSLYF